MTSSTPRLIYFAGRGRAEFIRMIFAAGGVEFENVRLKYTYDGAGENFDSKEFNKIKESLPFGQLPVLEWGDQQISQSFTIARYVARKVGLAGKNAEEDAKIDMIGDHVSEHYEGFLPLFEMKDEAAKKELANHILDKKIPHFLATSEGLLKKGGGPFFLGDRLTWADIAMMQRLDALADPAEPMLALYFDNLTKKGKYGRIGLLSGYPLLSNLCEKVKNVPEIKKWMDHRPTSKEEDF